MCRSVKRSGVLPFTKHACQYTIDSVKGQAQKPFTSLYKALQRETYRVDANKQDSRQPDKAIKADADKIPLDLLPFAALNEVGKVLGFGAKKYAAHNWRAGLSWSRLIAAGLRHLFAFAAGENNDPETGLCHLAHAVCCLLFLLEYVVKGGGTDDRYKKDHFYLPGRSQLDAR